jgi:EmrB/QacA subfamily drug resistance transporter
MNRIVPLILAVALFMEQMDSTVIATSLPAIAADIDTSPIALKLALTTYLVALAIFIPASGWMADRFGARRVFAIALAIFAAGSLACAISGSLAEFVGARFLQGIGGSMMTPVARLVLVRATARDRLVEAMAWLTVPALVGPLIGAPLGGFITTFFSWHWIFLVNLPIAAVGIALSWRFLPVIGTRETSRFDTTGFLLSGLACAGIVFGLSVISLPALPVAAGFAAFVAGIGMAAAYVAHARRTEHPVLDLRLFRLPAFRASISSGFVIRLGVGATPFLLPLLLQLGFGLTAFESGMVTFVGAAGAIAAKFVTARMFSAFGFKRVLIATVTLSALLLMALATFTPGIAFAYVYSLLFVGGLTRSLMFTGLNALSFAETDIGQMAPATAISAAFQQVSLAMGVAVAGLLLESSMAWRGAELGVDDFQFAFLAVGLVSLVALAPLLGLRADAGAAVSGHATPAVRAAE